MKDVIYRGTSNFQVFGPEDWAKADIERDEVISFPKNEPVEVVNAIADALVSDEGIFHDFHFELADEVDIEDEAEAEDPPKAKSKRTKTTKTGSEQQGVDTGERSVSTAGTSTAGNGSSTASAS